MSPAPKRCLSSGGPNTPANMAENIEEVNVAWWAKTHRKWHVCCVVLHYISYTSFCKSLEFLGTSITSLDPETVQLPAFYTLRHVYKSMWPTREAKPHFEATLVHSAHDCDTR